jgi:hypothetical protein
MSDSQPNDDRAVQSIPLDTEDGGQVVITQEAQGRQAIVGDGEFADPHEPRTPEQAARDQEALEQEAPTPPQDPPR